MREGLAGLTLRGRAFLAAGTTCVVAAVVLGHGSLARVGVLVAVLPLLAAWLLGRARYLLSLQREVAPATVAAGQPVQVQLTLTNDGRTPTGLLLLEDAVPFALGSRPRFVLEGIGHGWRRHVSYRVRSDVRGLFQIGPMTVRVSDPFGLVELGRAFTSTTSLTVTPRTVPLPATSLGGAWTGSGDNRPRAFATGSAEDVTVREYRRGDDLRRVHWRSSARVGELMVRREEQPWQSRATIVLDNRTGAHRGRGAASSFEAAVSAAASIAVHLVQHGHAVRLVTATGEEAGAAWHARDPAAETAAVLEALAMVRAEPVAQLDAGWISEAGAGGLTVAVLGATTDADLPYLSRLAHHSATASALCLHVDQWSRRAEPAGGDVARLHGRGFRAVGLGRHDDLVQVWRELGRSRHRTGLPGAGS